MLPWILLSTIIAAIILIVIIRAVRFKPEPSSLHKAGNDKPDIKRITESMSKMLQFKTVSRINRDEVDLKAFTDFKKYIKSRYPAVVKASKISEHGQSGILFKIKGKSPEAPVVLMSHYDVVPADGEWEHPPFSGKVTKGRIWGRGALDNKHTLCGIMEACEYLLSNKHEFSNDLYLAFSGDEEIIGGSAEAIVDHLSKQKVKPAIVIDEGGAVVENVFPGVKKRCAVVGIAEKGYLSLELSAKSKGGHASAPPDDTPVTVLSEAVCRVNKSSAFKLKLTESVKLLFNNVAKHSESFAIKLIFANLWLFLPVVKLLAKKTGGEFLAMFKTTAAFTMMSGSRQINVLPPEAKVGINLRILTGETVESSVSAIEKKINDPRVETKVVYGHNPSSVSRVDEGFDRVKDAILKTWSDVVVAPYLMTACTDSRSYHKLCDNVYRFSPVHMTRDEIGTIHGNNESIEIDNLMDCVKFYINFIKMS
jgi:carboxypeptidase PM20D1